jgi:hypothetical protein
MLEDRINLSATVNVLSGAIVYNAEVPSVVNTLSVSSANPGSGTVYTFTDSVAQIVLQAGALNAGWTTSNNGHTASGGGVTGGITINSGANDSVTTAFGTNLPGFLKITGGPEITAGAVTTAGAQTYSTSGGTGTFINGNLVTQGANFTINGPATLLTTVMIDATGGGAEAFGGAVSLGSTVNGAFGLTVNSGNGATHLATFHAAVGGTTPLTGFSVSGLSTILDGSVTTASGVVNINNALTLGANATIDTTAGGSSSGADVMLGSTTDAASAGGEALTINSGSGAVTLGGNVGGNNALSSLTVTGMTSIGGNIATEGGGITIAGDATLTQNSSISSTNGVPAGANIGFTGALDGGFTLSVNAGSGGSASFGGTVGGTTRPLSVAVTAGGGISAGANILSVGAQVYTGPITINGNLTTRGGQITLNNAATLTHSSAISTTVGTPAGANITFIGTVDGAKALTITAGTSGAVAFDATVGGTTPLVSLTATGATITAGAVATSGLESYTGVITLNGNLKTQKNPITFTGPVTLGNTVVVDSTNGGANNVGASITFTSTIDGATAGTEGLTVRGGTGGGAAVSGAIGGSAALLSLLINGNQNSVGAITTTNGGETLTGLGTSPTTTLNGDQVSDGGIIKFSSPIVLGTSVLVDTTDGGVDVAVGGNVTFVGTVDAASAGVQGLTITSGQMKGAGFQATVGGSAALASLSDTGNAIALLNVTTTGSQTYNTTGGSTPNTKLGGVLTTSGAAVSVTGPAFLTATASISTSGGDVTFNGTLDGTGAGTQGLSIAAGAGNVSFNSAVGGTTAPTDLTVTSASAASLGAVTTGSTVSVTAGTVTLSGNVSTGTLTIDATGTASQTGGALTASNLLLLGGSLSLTQSGNHVSTLAGNAIGISYTDSGAVTVGSVNGTNGLSDVSGSGATLNTGGTLTIGDGSAVTQAISFGSFTLTAGGAGVVISSNGSLSGSGTVNANLNNGGQASPGGTGATGTINVNGNYSQSGKLFTEVGSTADLLAVTGSATLGGSLHVSTISGFVDTLGNSYQVLTFGSRVGDFASKAGLVIGGGHAFNPVYSSGDLHLVDTQLGTDVSGSTQVTRGGLRFNPATSTYTQQITVTNTSGSTINGPLYLQLTGLSSSITLSNATGNSVNSSPGSPYVLLQSGALAAGGSVTITLIFYDPSLVAVSYNTHVFAGGIP